MVIHFDNAKPHFSKFAQKNIEELGYETLLYPPYSLDLALSDYKLFSSIQHFLSGKTYINKKEVQEDFQKFFSSKNQHFNDKGI